MKCDNLKPKLHRAPALILVGIIGYALYAFCYVYAYTLIYRHHSQGTGITLIVLLSFFLFLVIIDWACILFLGPGRATPQIPYNLSNHSTDPHLFSQDLQPPPPDVFICDPDGFPLWCSHCQSIKTDRVHHSAELGYCVDKMDHMCHWLGTVIGRRNMRFFMLLQLHFFMAIIIVLSSVPIYIRDLFKTQSVAHRVQICVLMGIAGFWAILLIPFMITNCQYVVENTTTIERLRYYKRNPQYPIFNIRMPPSFTVQQSGIHHPNGIRIVSRLRLGDPRPYDTGSRWENWKETFGPSPIRWVLPLPYLKFQNRSLSSNFDTREKEKNNNNNNNNDNNKSILGTYGTTNNQSLPPQLQSQSQSSKFTVAHNPKLIELMIDRFLKGEEGFYAYPFLQGLQNDSLDQSQHPNSSITSPVTPENSTTQPTTTTTTSRRLQVSTTSIPHSSTTGRPPEDADRNHHELEEEEEEEEEKKKTAIQTPPTPIYSTSPDRNSPLESLQPKASDLVDSSIHTDTAALIR
ncbi:uncharacterized protein SAPINGB_P001669 [Magnusiomyces paraingens]|uniref:Palmitoyltransferase n=1 Tax=Magnusiomyces paraingens TaxID=2606893 RepID=A0A5E8B7H5_9ASCO|nr:uncharacterized protein SAPINGB_P001669 [Saprochaete ingens]VVT47353.1 unnamed protein product [Saprochaete ingens]